MSTEMSREQEPLWWQRGVVYQIYPRSFQDSNGDGIGDLPGVLDRLDYLVETLGVDALWLSPFYPSPMADFGYDVSNYTDVDPIFGTLADFDTLVAQAHERGVSIIIDFVPNHTSEEHPWFVESRSSRDNPKRDWYVWRDAKPDGSLPNNWLSVFGGPAWEWDERTGQYYLHSFTKEQPDLNWRNPEVREAMLAAMRFWLERGVDGFRIDVAHLILKDPELRDNPPNPYVVAAPHRPQTYDYDTLLHVHDKGHPDVHQAFRQIRALLDEYSTERPRYSVGEIHEYDWPVWASYYGTQLDELHMPFNFALLTVPWTAADVRRVVDGVEAAVPPGAWPNYVLGNHDTSRIASRVGLAEARIGMMLLLTLRGTPTLYYGDEIGMSDVTIPPEWVRDPFEKNVPGRGLGRDPERTPMQWDAGPNAGFCPPGVTPWLPLAADYPTINVAVEGEEPGSFLTLTRRLLALRRAEPALHVGSYRPVEEAPENCFLYVREHEQRRFLVALNFSAEPRLVDLHAWPGADVVLSTQVDREGHPGGAYLELRPNEGCVLLVPGS